MVQFILEWEGRQLLDTRFKAHPFLMILPQQLCNLSILRVSFWPKLANYNGLSRHARKLATI